jgi:hypothetical protein
VSQHANFEAETLFDSEAVSISAQKLEGPKEGYRKAIERTMLIGRRAAAFAGLAVVSDEDPAKFPLC